MIKGEFPIQIASSLVKKFTCSMKQLSKFKKNKLANWCENINLVQFYLTELVLKRCLRNLNLSSIFFYITPLVLPVENENVNQQLQLFI